MPPLPSSGKYGSPMPAAPSVGRCARDRWRGAEHGRREQRARAWRQEAGERDHVAQPTARACDSAIVVFRLTLDLNE